MSSGSRRLLRDWWSSSWYGKNAAGEVMPIRSILPVSHRSKIRTIPVRRLSRRMNRKYAVQEPRIWRVLLTGNPQQHAKNRRICCPRIVKIALQELQNPRSQNRRNCRQVRKKKERLIKVIWKSVSLSEPRCRTDGPTGTQKKNFWIFWTAASLNASHRKPLWCLKTPLSGFFMPTASVLAMPRFRKAACGQSSDGWTA